MPTGSTIPNLRPNHPPPTTGMKISIISSQVMTPNIRPFCQCGRSSRVVASKAAKMGPHSRVPTMK